jgi:hypothetical protein
VQRPWAVRPDQENGVLSREALIAALVDAATMLDIAGGCLEVVVGRAPTDVPGEMVMTGAMLCWKDRTDAKPQREPEVQVTPEPEPIRPHRRSSARPIVAAADADEDGRAGGAVGDADDGANVDPDDGFNYTAMPEEDIEDAPQAVRA